MLPAMENNQKPAPPSPPKPRREEAIFDAVLALPPEKPVFVVEYPAETSPLSRRNDADPTKVDRFELFIVGREHALRPLARAAGGPRGPES